MFAECEWTHPGQRVFICLEMSAQSTVKALVHILRIWCDVAVKRSMNTLPGKGKFEYNMRASSAPTHTVGAPESGFGSLIPPRICLEKIKRRMVRNMYVCTYVLCNTRSEPEPFRQLHQLVYPHHAPPETRGGCKFQACQWLSWRVSVHVSV